MAHVLLPTVAPDRHLMQRLDNEHVQVANPVIVFDGRLLVVGEVYFLADVPPVRVDRMLAMQAPAPIERSRCTTFHTRVVDLLQEPASLWDSIHKGCRYKIRRAESGDGVQCVRFTRPSGAVAEAFRRFHHRFALARGISPVSADWLAAAVEVGAVELSRASDSGGRELVWHSYYRSADRVRLMHSASLLPSAANSDVRGLIGRANRRLHWEDMKFFQSVGVRTYDFGGWYTGREDQTKLGINAFKEQFGGRVIQEYNCDLLLTTRARVLARVPQKLRQLASRNGDDGQQILR